MWWNWLPGLLDGEIPKPWTCWGAEDDSPQPGNGRSSKRKRNLPTSSNGVDSEDDGVNGNDSHSLGYLELSSGSPQGARLWMMRH